MSLVYVAPGRVELVGKHVDYAGGRSLTFATSMAVRATVTLLDEPGIRVADPHAKPYTDAVARRFLRDFPEAKRGVSLTLSSDLPESAGLSSSSAVVVAAAQALADANDMDTNERWTSEIADNLARAAYFAAMETGEPFGSFPGDPGVGVRGGAQDHVAIIAAELGQVRQFSYLPPVLERSIEWPRDFVVVIADSGVRATKTANAQAAYNNLSDGMRGFNRRPRSPIPPHLTTRVAQFREETDVIVPGVGDSLRDRNFDRLGKLVDRSQALAETVLKNQVRETIFLARDARAAGAIAASAFGAGFGGAVWAMVAEANSAQFARDWGDRYARAFPERVGRIMITRPGRPLHVES